MAVHFARAPPGPVQARLARAAARVQQERDEEERREAERKRSVTKESTGDQRPAACESSAPTGSSAASCETPEEYLQTVGYNPGFPKGLLDICVERHAEVDGHTTYMLTCTFCATSDTWVCKKRLCEIRGQLHDPLKKLLRDSYGKSFGETPFAHHGGVPGTTARLHAWFGSLATLMNSGTLEPYIVAMVMRFLETPTLA
eukprot:gnl/TRDRNA2_/TRDRNA2_80651_c0_seq2.p1 gnl/TRDRNA2_/TRDRNA2_80651_c0~~gnl/TRDRNA2_/TRDRNA2_80651_c0_seq2.p1  ORF type:complete len:200 (-),score=37.54 gnl/TRDRNA2_/TRDRNA2_80651_c0_seq2:43-642(-)